MGRMTGGFFALALALLMCGCQAAESSDVHGGSGDAESKDGHRADSSGHDLLPQDIVLDRGEQDFIPKAELVADVPEEGGAVLPLDTLDEECVPYCGGQKCGADNACGGICTGPEGVCEGIDLCDGVMTCTEEGECVNEGEPITCDDQQYCNGEETCTPETGECQDGTPPELDDGIDCTVDSCDEDKNEVVHMANDDACIESGPCESGVCNPADGCIYSAIPDGKYDTCDDQNPCTADVCTSGECESTLLALDELADLTLTFDDCICASDDDCVPLEDGNLCNGTLVCDLSADIPVCTLDSQTVVECKLPDKVVAACNVVACVPETGECQVSPANDELPCDDFDKCTVTDACAEGKCVGSGGPDCDDGKPCTADKCDPVEGCQNVADDSLPCDDEDACTSESCSSGECQQTPMDCDDKDECTQDSCNPASGCSYVVVDPDDEDKCTFDSCDKDAGVQHSPVDCDDAVGCTIDSCDPAKGCMHAPQKSLCLDDDLCNGTEKCDAVKDCQPGTPLDCIDENACTTDSCHSTDGCQHAPVDCDDKDECTQDSCNPASGCSYVVVDPDDEDKCTFDSCDKDAGVQHSPVDCDDAVGCTIDSCDPAKGCMHAPQKSLCLDDDLCNGTEKCDAVKDCQPGTPLVCDDQIHCTVDSCDHKTGCQSAPDDAKCNDGFLCTDDSCDADTGCENAPDAAKCDDGNPCTDDSCDPVDGCTFVPVDGDCDDSSVCTVDDTCSDGECQPGEQLVCDDDNVCTDDSCAPGVGCVFTNNSAACDDGDKCTTVDLCQEGECVGTEALTCQDDEVCTADSCDPVDGCTFVPVDGDCEDGSLCTVGDTCSDGECQPGEHLVCDDDYVCTDDSCDAEVGCVFTNNSAACDDGDKCTTLDLCQEGQCFGPGEIDCTDYVDMDHPPWQHENLCTTDSCDPAKGCLNVPISPCCPNGVFEPGEECDDGNYDSGDGCEYPCVIG